jgi:DNA-binding CsgD family transcriptional regulator
VSCRFGAQDLSCSFEQLAQRVKLLAELDSDCLVALFDMPASSDHDGIVSALTRDRSAFVHGDWAEIADIMEGREVCGALDVYRGADGRAGAPAIAVYRGDAFLSLVPVFPDHVAPRKLLVWISKSKRAPFAWTRLQQTITVPTAPRRNAEPLTARELEVTRWISEGKTSVEIGMILDLSEHTVNEYIRSSMTKLNCANRMHLISTSIRLGLLA